MSKHKVLEIFNWLNCVESNFKHRIYFLSLFVSHLFGLDFANSTMKPFSCMLAEFELESEFKVPF